VNDRTQNTATDRSILLSFRSSLPLL